MSRTMATMATTAAVSPAIQALRRRRLAGILDIGRGGETVPKLSCLWRIGPYPKNHTSAHPEHVRGIAPWRGLLRSNLCSEPSGAARWTQVGDPPGIRISSPPPSLSSGQVETSGPEK